MSSIFTRIINREIPSSILYEDDVCIAILDIHPVQPGHTLIIPKQELPWMDQYDDTTVAHCMVIAKKLMSHMKQVMEDIKFVYLAVEGLEVPHRHTHLIPYSHTIKDKPKFERSNYEAGQQEYYYNLLSTDLSD